MEKPAESGDEECCPEMKGIPGMMMRKEMKIIKMDADLKLTDEQQKQVDDIEYKSALETAKLRADLDVARINFDYEMRKDPPDEGKVKTLLVKIGDLETNLKILEITKKLKIGKILTPEQRKMMMKAHQCPCRRPMP
jgi:Spy/CpxP family protein refolding chaperone